MHHDVNHPNPAMRLRALLHIIRHPNRHRVELLSRQRPNSAARRMALWGLRSSDTNICLAAVNCLRRWRADKLASALLPLLDHHNTELVKAVIRTLGYLGYCPALERLTGFLSHSPLAPVADRAIKAIIQRALPEQLNGLGIGATGHLLLYLANALPAITEDEKMAAKLSQAIKWALSGHDVSEFYLQRAFACFAKVSPRPHIPQLLNLLQGNQPAFIKENAAKILLSHDGLIMPGRHNLRPTAHTARHAPGKRRGKTRSRQGLAIIRQLLGNSHDGVRLQAVMALDGVSIPYLANALNRDRRVKVAWMAGKMLCKIKHRKAITALASGLSRQKTSIRCICLHYLAQAGNLWPWLGQLAADPHPMVRHRLLRTIADHKRIDWYLAVADKLRNDPEDKIKLFCLELDMSWGMANHRLIRTALSESGPLAGRAVKLLGQSPQGVEVLKMLLHHTSGEKKIAALNSLPYGSESAAFMLLKDNNPAVRAASSRALRRWQRAPGNQSGST